MLVRLVGRFLRWLLAPKPGRPASSAASPAPAPASPPGPRPPPPPPPTPEEAAAREQARDANNERRRSLVEAITARRCPRCSKDTFLGEARYQHSLTSISPDGSISGGTVYELVARCASCDHRELFDDLGSMPSLARPDQPWPGFLDGAPRPEGRDTPAIGPDHGGHDDAPAPAALPLTLRHGRSRRVSGFEGIPDPPGGVLAALDACPDGIDVKGLGEGPLLVNGRDARKRRLAAEGDLIDFGSVVLEVGSAGPFEWRLAPTSRRVEPPPSSGGAEDLRDRPGPDGSPNGFTVPRGEERTIGRSSEAQIALPPRTGRVEEEALVRISVRGERCLAVDLGGYHGRPRTDCLERRRAKAGTNAIVKGNLIAIDGVLYGALPQENGFAFLMLRDESAAASAPAP